MSVEIRRREFSSLGGLPTDWPDYLKRIYSARGINDPTRLDMRLQQLEKPQTLTGIREAVALLVQAVKEDWRIRVIGDFDADGATSSALLVHVLRILGVRDVDFLVPNRFDFGYGLSPEIVEVAAKVNPDLLITVDNGISSLSGVAYARELGIKVLITDHHLPGEELPAADVIVNPNLSGDQFPSKSLAGVGVVFYVLLALRSELRAIGWFSESGQPDLNLASYLDLLALGTIADVVPLDDNNRILVEQGLRRIRAGQSRPGIQALLSFARRPLSSITATDLAFTVAPRLNAAGRLEDMSLGIRCLLSESKTEARALAMELDSLNSIRRELEADMLAEAESALAAYSISDGTEMPVALCVFEKQFHEGVVGIIASRLKERFHRPVIVFARTKDGTLKGSGRSIPEVHLRDVLADVATQHPAILNKFGGHAMAAGLSLDLKDLDMFDQAFCAAVRHRLPEAVSTQYIWTDGPLTTTAINLKTAKKILFSGPWGQQFPEPVFDGVFVIHSARWVGEIHLKLRISLNGFTAQNYEAVFFRPPINELPATGSCWQIAYRLDVNHYQGQQQLQLLIQAMLPAPVDSNTLK